MKKWFLVFLLVLVSSPGFAAEPSTRIVIFGDSRSNGKNASGFNNEVLERELKQIQPLGAKAVFFTGDLTVGLEKEEGTEAVPEEKEIPHGQGSDIYDTHWARKGFVYNSADYQQQLDGFQKLEQQILGAALPFYPLIGNHEAMGPDAVERFRKTFNIPNVAPVGEAHLAYTVAIGNSLFVVIATDYYDRERKSLVEANLSTQTLDWLEKALKTARPKFQHIFVLGHEPAFTVQHDPDDLVGLDRVPETRDRFWSLLKENNVDAYICAHQHLFDQSQIKGVWQIVTGGAGAPLEKGKPGAFYHYLILEIPADPSPAKFTVIDLEGKERGSWVLTSH